MKIVANKSAFILGFLITLTLLVGGFEIAGIALFKWILLITSIFCTLSIRKLKVNNIDKLFLLFLACVLLSVFGASFNTFVDVSFIVGNLVNLMLIGITVKLMEDAGCDVLNSFVKGVEISCYFQGFYCIAQAIFRMLAGYSLNRMIFQDILHISDTTSIRDIINEGIFVEYGMNSHPSVLIPIIIIMMCFCNNRTLAIVLSLVIIVLSRNSTTVIAFFLCLFMPLLVKHIKTIYGKRKGTSINKKRFFRVFAEITIGIIILFASGWYIKVFELVNRTWVRLIGNAAAVDYSTRTHALYYTSIPKVLSQSGIINILFGNGYDSSGDVITHAGVVFSTAKNWAIEADPVNLLYGIGLIGTIVFYFWTLRGLKKAYKWDEHYLTFTIAVIICGITYRIQYMWFIMFELALARLVKNNVNIIEDENRHGTKRLSDKSKRLNKHHMFKSKKR